MPRASGNSSPKASSHFLCTVVNEGIWIGWMGCTGWNTGFFLTSEWAFTVGSSWFRLIICRASCVLPRETLPIKENQAHTLPMHRLGH